MTKPEPQIFNRVDFGPMGVSQWREHGKKYGYWEYFKEEAVKEAMRDISKVPGAVKVKQ